MATKKNSSKGERVVAFYPAGGPSSATLGITGSPWDLIGNYIHAN